MCLSNSHVDDNMSIFAFRCLHSDVSVELHADDIMLICLSNSHVDDNMPMCLSKLQLILSTVGEQKSHPLLNEGTCIREYSTIRPSYNGRLNDLKEMCSIGLNLEYSRMQVPSLSSGCDFARFLFATWCRTHKMIACRCVSKTHMLMITCRCSHADVSVELTCWWYHVDVSVELTCWW